MPELVTAKSLPRTRSGDDSHTEDIVRIVREAFGKGNEFAHLPRLIAASPVDYSVPSACLLV